MENEKTGEEHRERWEVAGRESAEYKYQCRDEKSAVVEPTVYCRYVSSLFFSDYSVLR